MTLFISLSHQQHFLLFLLLSLQMNWLTKAKLYRHENEFLRWKHELWSRTGLCVFEIYGQLERGVEDWILLRSFFFKICYFLSKSNQNKRKMSGKTVWKSKLCLTLEQKTARTLIPLLKFIHDALTHEDRQWNWYYKFFTPLFSLIRFGFANYIMQLL